MKITQTGSQLVELILIKIYDYQILTKFEIFIFSYFGVHLKILKILWKNLRVLGMIQTILYKIDS